MPSNDIQSVLLAGLKGGSGDELQRLRSQLDQLTNTASQQVASLKENTGALVAASATRSAGEVAASATKGIASALGIGTMLSPLITGIAKLFSGGNKQEAVPAPIAFQRPATVSWEAALASNGSSTPVDYGQDGMPRRVAAPQPQVTIQIQALDSQSIMDRSADLAKAVRQAMLESHRLNDVISEL